jgi:hypothetical protein
MNPEIQTSPFLDILKCRDWIRKKLEIKFSLVPVNKVCKVTKPSSIISLTLEYGRLPLFTLQSEIQMRLLSCRTPFPLPSPEPSGQGTPAEPFQGNFSP